jgi:hypothetical protein
MSDQKYVLINTDKHGVCWKCETAFVSGDEVRQVTIPMPDSTCEHKTLIRNIHKDCLEKSNG